MIIVIVCYVGLVFVGDFVVAVVVHRARAHASLHL